MDACILPFFEGKTPAFSAKGKAALFSAPIKAGDFTGKKGERLCHYPSTGSAKRLILLGLGKEKQLTKEVLRRAYASAVSHLKGKAKSVEVHLPVTNVLEKDAISIAAAEGVYLANYVFDVNKSIKDKALSQIKFVGGVDKALKRTKIVCDSVYFTRNLNFSNADDVTPTFLGQIAKDLAAEYAQISTKVLGRKEIEKQKLGLLEAVSRGSATDPALILIEYRGDPKSKELNAFVGKGVTYDTGGLNLKPTGSMETMREDMSGAGAVLGTMRTLAALKLPINVIGVIGSTENAIGPKSYKPGDVYRSYSGVTVEVTNTDAEGRLVLADALSYVQKKYALKRIINIATLTGGAVVALGEEVTALMSNDDQLSAELTQAGESTYERVWRLPLYEEYEDILKSKIADIKNSGQRKASPIQGGIFLKRFIGKVKWAHLDIAGTASPDPQKPYHSIQSTGVGVRLMTEFFECLCSK
ncbi:MAG: Cytosol aminopeptidase [Chlamydiae bacterium]|nr:Cytosol aminopeptidase [Chlamydiota bacterium]